MILAIGWAFIRCWRRVALRCVVILVVLGALIFTGFRSIGGLCWLVGWRCAFFNVRTRSASFIGPGCSGIRIGSIGEVVVG
jgi:hypothetical protein